MPSMSGATESCLRNENHKRAREKENNKHEQKDVKQSPHRANQNVYSQEDKIGQTIEIAKLAVW